MLCSLCLLLFNSGRRDFFHRARAFCGCTLVAARKQLEIVNNQYRDGLITYLGVATAESTALNVEFTATQLRGQQLVATVTLIKALGGSWQSNETIRNVKG